MNHSDDKLIEIDGQRNIVPDPDKNIKIPIEITSNSHFTRASTEIVEEEPLNSA